MIKKSKTAIYIGSSLKKSELINGVNPIYEKLLRKRNIIIFASETYKEFIPVKYSLDVKFYDSKNFKHLFHHEINIVRLVISDHNIPLLWSRSHRNFRNKYGTEISRFEKQLDLINSAINFIKRENISKVIFSYEPHNLPMYIFKKVCYFMKIKSITVKTSPFFNRVFAVNDLNNKIIPNRKKDRNNIDKFIKDNIIDLNYDLSKKKFGIKIFDMSFLYNLNYHYYLKKKFTTRKIIFKTDYAVFFLHQQPELTTLPDGDIFVSQLEAIKISHEMCKQLNLKLIIREHPATATYFNRNWRSKIFIDKILSFGDNIIFDDHRESSKNIILNSKVIISITGTVLTEALINGIPVVAFGQIPLRGFKGNSLVRVLNNHNLFESLQFALKMKKNEIIEEINTYLHNAYEVSFGIDKSYSELSEMGQEELYNLIRMQRNDIILELLEIGNEKN